MNNFSQYYYLQDNRFLLEYEFNSLVLPLREYNFLKILDRQYVSDNVTYTSYNQKKPDLIKEKLNNSLDTLVQNVNTINTNDEFIRFDREHNIRFWEQAYGNLTFYRYLDYVRDFPELDRFNVVYDTIKIHILQGYNFDDIHGLVIRAYYINGGSRIYICNQSFLKSDELNYNKKNVRIEERIYDKYITISIPQLESLRRIENIIDTNNDYPNDNKTILKIEVLDIIETDLDEKGVTKLKVDTPYTSDMSKAINIFSDDIQNNLNPIIRESKNGDYFEFFVSYNGDFISDLIYTNPKFRNMVIYHEIVVEENTDTPEGIEGNVTQSFTFLQTAEDGFDKPFIFRPVILNSNVKSFTIYYFARLLLRANAEYNDVDNSQIVRSASLTYMNAQKYGRYLEKLNVQAQGNIKIINRIESKSEKIDNNSINYNLFANDSFKSFNLLSSDFIVPIDRASLAVNIREVDINNINDFNNNLNIINNGEATLVLNKLSDSFFIFDLYKYIDNIKGYEPVKVIKLLENNIPVVEYNLVFDDDLVITNKSLFSDDNKQIVLNDNSVVYYIPKGIIQEIHKKGITKANIIIKNKSFMYNGYNIQELTNFETNLITMNIQVID